MNYKHTVKDIIKDTGLNKHYILKCVRENKEYFDSFCTNGAHNITYFDDNALSTFREINNRKARGSGYSEIKEYLKNLVQEQNNSTENSVNSNSNSMQFSVNSDILDRLEKSYKQVIDAKNEVINSKEREVRTLEEKVLLLTDGKSPEERKREWEEKEIALQEKQEVLLKTQNELREKDSKLLETEEEIKKRDAVLQEKEQKLTHEEQEKKALQEKFTTKMLEYKRISEELISLKGKWFVGKKRKELEEQLLALG